MDENASARIAALEEAVRELAARLEGRSAGEGEISRLETENALLRDRLAEVEQALSETDESIGSAAFETGGPAPSQPTPELVEPDTRVLKGTSGPNGREDKSLDWAEGAESVLQLHGFDKTSNLVHEVADPDPDDESADDDPIQFAGRVPKDGDIAGGAELKWFELKPGSQRKDTDETGTRTTPGQSIDTVTVRQAGGKTTKDLQLRQFANVADTQTVLAADATGSGYKPEDVHVLMRRTKTGERPKLVYVVAGSGPFWVKGATNAQNYAASIAIGDPTNGYISLSVEQPSNGA